VRALSLTFAVLLSGAAGLAYQVAWTRRLANVTSAMITAQATVLAVFMAGLGLGAMVAARPSARVKRPLRVYAVVELTALLLAIASLSVIDSSDAIRGAAQQLGMGAKPAMWTQLVAICAFLVLPTSLMGASLPFVIADAEQTLRRPEAMVGLLYGVNTLGAAGGCALAGLVAIERLGLTHTITGGATLALGAGLLALVLPSHGHTPQPQSPEQQEPVAAVPAAPLVATAALAGLVGMGAEVIWTRLLALVVLNTVYAFTQVLVGVLVGIGLGGLVAAALTRRPNTKPAATVTILLTIAAMMLAAVPHGVAMLATSTSLRVSLASGLSVAGLGLVLLLVVVPSACIAAVLPLLVTASTTNRGSSRSRAFAWLYAANTAAGVAGSLVTGFVLLPTIGAGNATWALSLVTVLAALILLKERWLYRIGLGAALAAACTLFALTIQIPQAIYAAQLPTDAKILEFREGSVSDVFVSEEADGRRRLWINSSWVAGTGGGHRLLGHLPALSVAAPNRALGIALGTGQTFAAVMKHGGSELHCVELDDNVIELSRRWFGQVNDNLFDDPRVIVHHDDGRAFLRATNLQFDLIVIEPLQAWSAGTSSLYSRQFYREARRALAPGGVVAQWLPLYIQANDETLAMTATALEVFPHASLWLDRADGILLLHDTAVTLSPRSLTARTTERGIGSELASNHVRRPADLLGLFAAGSKGLRGWTQGARIIDDDRPFLEFAAARSLSRVPDARFTLRALAAHLEDPRSYAPMAERSSPVFAEAVAIRSGIMAASLINRQSFEERANQLEVRLRQAPSSALLLDHYRNVMLEWASAERNNEQAIFQRALDNAPTHPDFIMLVALSHLERDDRDGARKTLEQAAERDALPATGKMLLDQLRRALRMGNDERQ